MSVIINIVVDLYTFGGAEMRARGGAGSDAAVHVLRDVKIPAQSSIRAATNSIGTIVALSVASAMSVSVQCELRTATGFALPRAANVADVIESGQTYIFAAMERDTTPHALTRARQLAEDVDARALLHNDKKSKTHKTSSDNTKQLKPTSNIRKQEVKLGLNLFWFFKA